MIRIRPQVLRQEDTPIVEWWDSFFLPEGKQDFGAINQKDELASDPTVFFLDRVTNYV